MVLVVDVAYLNFAGTNGCNFFELFTGLPDNMIVIVAFSMFKCYILYSYLSLGLHDWYLYMLKDCLPQAFWKWRSRLKAIRGK